MLHRSHEVEPIPPLRIFMRNRLFLRAVIASFIFTFSIPGFCQTDGSTLSVELVPGPVTPTPIVRFNDTWHYIKGNAPPQPNWKTAADGELVGWSTGPGGFGYADGDDATQFAD